MSYPFQYNPGVEDRSGEYIMQGGMQRAQAIAAGIGSASQSLAGGIKGYAAKAEEDKNFEAKAKSTEAYIKSHADETGLDEHGLEQLLANNPHESPVQRYARLDQYMGEVAKDHVFKQQAAETQLAQQKLAQEKMQMGQQQIDLNALRGATAPTAGLADQIGQGQNFRQLDPNAPNPALMESYLRRGGSNPQHMNQLNDIDVARLRAKSPTLDLDKIRGADAKGQPIEITLDKHTGQEISRGPIQRPVLSPEEEGQKALQVEDAQLRTKDAYKVLADTTDSAELARATSANVSRVLSLYQQGAQSGFGQPVMTQAKAALGRLGLGDDTKLATQQDFEQAMNKIVLDHGRELMKGSGSVSNYERSIVEKASANSNNSPQANTRILTVLKAISDRNVQLDALRSDLEQKGVPSVEIASQIRRARATIPVGVDTLTTIKPDGTIKGASNPAADILKKYGVK